MIVDSNVGKSLFNLGVDYNSEHNVVYINVGFKKYPPKKQKSFITF